LQEKKLPDADAPRIIRRKRRSPATKRVRRSSTDVMNLIVRAATEEFKRSGYAAATTATIARKAGVTEAQLFRCFESKSNLFRETIFKPIEEHFRNFTNEHISDLSEAANLKEMTRLYTTELQRFLSEHAQMLMSLVVSQTYDSGTAQGVGEINSLRTYFELGAAMMTRRLKGRPKVDPKVMVRVTFGAVLAGVLFRDWIFPPDVASDAEITAAINDFVMEGLGANRD
jgi:AcrR family transcriptional regulator